MVIFSKVPIWSIKVPCQVIVIIRCVCFSLCVIVNRLYLLQSSFKSLDENSIINEPISQEEKPRVRGAKIPRITQPTLASETDLHPSGLASFPLYSALLQPR